MVNHLDDVFEVASSACLQLLNTISMPCGHLLYYLLETAVSVQVKAGSVRIKDWMRLEMTSVITWLLLICIAQPCISVIMAITLWLSLPSMAMGSTLGMEEGLMAWVIQMATIIRFRRKVRAL